MKRHLLTVVAFGLTLTSAQASVVINSTNFPDENFRAQVAEAFDSDGDGTISDEEMEANGGHHNFDRVSNLKGIELLTSITELQIINYPDEPGLTTFDYELPNLHWLEFQDQVGSLTTVDATKCTNLEDFGVIENPAGLSTLKLPSSLKSLNLCYAPLVKTFDPKQFPNLQTMSLFGNTGITDLDFSNHKSIQNISVVGYDEPYQLNSLNMVNCPELTNIDIKVCTIKSLTFKSLPEMLSILVYESDITNMLVDDLSQLGSIEANNNVLSTLTLNNLPAIYGLSCESNKLQTLIIDKCPGMNGINAEHNRLMWLDLQDVKKGGTDENTLKIDDQQPQVQAVKISPTEVGLRVHERLDVSRVLNLRAKGIRPDSEGSHRRRHPLLRLLRQRPRHAQPRGQRLRLRVRHEVALSVDGGELEGQQPARDAERDELDEAPGLPDAFAESRGGPLWRASTDGTHRDPLAGLRRTDYFFVEQ